MYKKNTQRRSNLFLNMLCKSCGDDFDSGSHQGVRLTIICEKCVTSDELITLTNALSSGATRKDLSGIRCLYKRNPHFYSAARMCLYVPEEVDVFATTNESAKRMKASRMIEERSRLDQRKDKLAESRKDCYTKRMDSVKGNKPTPGIVSGDFCRIDVKKTKVGVRSLERRRKLWNSFYHSDVDLNHVVLAFEWSVKKKIMDTTIHDALERIDRENYLSNKISSMYGCGETVLSFLTGVDTIVFCETKPLAKRSLFRLKSHETELVLLSEKLTEFIDVPVHDIFFLVYKSVVNEYWVSDYFTTMNVERVAMILKPHFYDDKDDRINADAEESFRRWEMSKEHIVHHVKYFRGDIVDVELFSASCYVAKEKIDVNVEDTLRNITYDVMHNQNTWLEATKSFVKNYKERHICICGNKSAWHCVYNKCYHCCDGPCTRHGK